jgi:hypothetical protein
MFRVIVFCNDNKLANILHALAGIAIGNPEIQPVANGKNDRGKVVARADGDPVAMFGAYLKQRRLTEINSTIGREFCRSIGKDPERYNYLFQQAQREGLLRKTGKATLSKWRVMR